MPTYAKLGNVSLLGSVKSLYHRAGQLNTFAKSWPIQRHLNACGVLCSSFSQLVLVVCYHLTHILPMSLGLLATFKNVNVIIMWYEGSKTSAKAWWCSALPRCLYPSLFFPCWESHLSEAEGPPSFCWFQCYTHTAYWEKKNPNYKILFYDKEKEDIFMYIADSEIVIL